MMMNKKRLYSFCIIAVMLFSIVVSPISAFAGDSVDDMVARSITSKSDTFDAVDESTLFSYCQNDYNGITYYGEGNALYTQIRDCMDNMDSSIEVYYFSPTKFHPDTMLGVDSWRRNALALISDIIDCATDYRLSVSCTDGDYSRWSYDSYRISNYTLDNSDSKGYYYSFDLSFDYRYSKAQEQSLTELINQCVNNVMSSCLSDYEALLYVHDFICDRVRYSNEATQDPDAYPDAYSAYSLVTGRAVCQGYALAFYRICRALGYNVRFAYSNPDVGNHAWNVIMVDNKVYNVDCTWDDANRDGMRFDGDNYYFLVDNATLTSNDGLTGTHILQNTDVYNSFSIGNGSNSISQTRYDAASNDNLISSAKFNLSYSQGFYSYGMQAPIITAVDKNGIPLINGVDYVVDYHDLLCGLRIVDIVGCGRFVGTSTTRAIYILPYEISAPSANASKATDKSVLLNFDMNGAPSCEIQMYKNSSWVTIATAYSGSYSVTGLSPARSYKFRVRNIVNINKTRYEGGYSPAISACTAPKAVSGLKVTAGKKALTARWKKDSGNGYQLQYGLKSNMSGAKTVKITNIKTVAKTVKKLKKGKKYYVRIRAYKTCKDSKGKTQYSYSKWSGKKAVKVK